MLNKLFLRRNFSSAIQYSEHGHPTKVLSCVPILDTKKQQSLKDHQVMIKFTACPINPADLNMVSGGYGINPASFPAIAGNEGVAVVTKIGSKVQNFKVNDRVIPVAAGFGTWRNDQFPVDANEVLKISDKISIHDAATLSVNPATALRMLRDFVDLKKGDVIVQNGANSSVGQAVIQLSKLFGFKTVNIVRVTEQYPYVVDHLKSIGGDIVCTDDFLKTPEFKRLISDLPVPKLGLNCVGGKLATNVARVLGNNGTLVTYGGMSKEPVTIPTSLFIFKNITVKGFWLSQWVKNATLEEKSAMLTELSDLVEKKKLRTWIAKYKFSEFSDALDSVVNRTNKDRKVVLMMDE